MPNILTKPLVTEKSMREAGAGRYTFAVEKTASKPQIRAAVEDAFKVKVKKVQTVTLPGKTKRGGRKRLETFSQPWKKAIVTLEAGQKIDLFSTSEQTPAK